MVIAMMVPLVSGSIRDTAARSLWARRQRAVAGFMAGYLTIWLLAGLAICAAVEGLRWVHWNPAIAVVVAFCIAAVWQLTPAKTRALRSCHRTLPLAPLGWSADRDSVRFGRLIGVACVGSCWALMAACAATGHSVLGMTFASCVCFAERYQFRPNQRVLAGVIAGFAAIFGVTALF
jgi:predicted metal-binding membrane protein